MNPIQRLREWWQVQTGEEETPFDGDTPAWAVSLVVHLVFLAILTAATLAFPSNQINLVLSTDVPLDETEELIPDKFYFSEEVQPEIGANSIAGSEVALAEAPIEAEISDVPTPEIQAEVGTLVLESPAELASGPNVSSDAIVRGAATGVGATGAMGAIDRITHEILLSLEQRRTLVVWLFDRSGSLQQQREAIHDRFDRIYHELGVIEAAGNEAFAKHDDKPLLTSVVSFGSDVKLLTEKPTDVLEEIKGAVESIENDASGVERVFSAIHEAATQFRSYRIQEPRRNVMLVVFTDEAGDDQSDLDPTVDICRKYQMPVYVVGVPAPFGREEVAIKYVDPDPEFDQRPQWIPVRQGPETFYPERIKLHFSGSGERDEPIDSGFGPYSLTRLCVETGGLYFAVHPNRNTQHEVGRNETANLSAHMSHFFNPVIMRSYRPDYVSLDEYKRVLGESTTRQALVQASMLSWAASMDSPVLTFPKESEADLANKLSEAQKQAARLEPQVQKIYDVMVLGEKDRDKLKGLRWQAGYDLAMGRTLAVMVRTQAYNAMLAKAKTGLKFEKEDSDTWVLKPSDEISVGSALEKAAESARVYLQRCVKEHEGTPWALLAARELKEPLGWEWTETHTGVNEPRMAAGGNGNANPNDDRRRMLTKPKPVRKPKL